MYYTEIFRQTWYVLRRSWVLWVVAALALSLGTISNLITRLGSRWAMSRLFAVEPDMATHIEQWLTQISRPGPIIGGFVVFMLWFLLTWVVATLGEGGMIHAAATTHNGQTARFGQALAKGWQLLVPFIAIDTIVFFPLFVLLLLIMILGAAALFIGIILGARNGTITSFILPLVIGGGMATVLSFFLIPLILVTMVFRSLTFRAAALQNLGVRESIRHTWQLIRQKTGPIIALAALIFGLTYLLSMVSTFLIMPLSLLESMPNFRAISASGVPSPEFFFSPLTVIAILFSVFVTFGIQIVTTVANSTFWTVAYQELVKSDLSH